MTDTGKKRLVTVGLAAIGAAAMMAGIRAADSDADRGGRKNHRFGDLHRRHPGEDEKRAARKAQKKARAINRKKRK